MTFHRTLRLLAAWACFTGAVSCSSVPISNKTVQGDYRLTGTWYAGEHLILREKEFEYGRFTDVVYDDPQMDRYPIRGQYALEGCLLTLGRPGIEHPHRIITPHKGRFIILTPKEADCFLQTGKVSDAALHQGPLNPRN